MNDDYETDDDNWGRFKPHWGEPIYTMPGANRIIAEKDAEIKSLKQALIGKDAHIELVSRQSDRLRAINAEYAALATEYQNSDMGENELAARLCDIRDRNALAPHADGSAADADGGQS